MTATAGGVIRDMLSSQVPLILRKEIYASACLAGGILFYLLTLLDWPHSTVMLLAATLVVGLRLLAIRHNWALPTANLASTRHKEN